MRPSSSKSNRGTLNRQESEIRFEEEIQHMMTAILANLRRQGKTLEHVLASYSHQSLDDVTGVKMTLEGFRMLLVNEGEIKDKTIIDYLISRASEKVNQEYLDYTELFKSLILDIVVFNLAKRQTPLRVIFKKFDKNSYGYLTRIQVSEMLTDICGLPVDESHFFLELIDPEKNGNIDYRKLFHRFFQTPTALRRRDAWMMSRKIRKVIIITRHGARFPLKPFPRDTHWPKDKLFWDDYGGKLTPVGVHQHVRLGQRMHRKYIRNEKLLDEQSPDISLRVRAYTTNQDRTLMSAQSFLLGMFPGTSPKIALEASNQFASSERKPRSKFSDNGYVPSTVSGSGISINISSEKHTPLMHGYKNNPAYDNLKEQVFAQGRFETWAADPQYQAVMDKLWEMTGYKKLDPSAFKYSERVKQLQTIAQQMAIERSHQMEVLLNAGLVRLQPEDEEIIREVAEYTCRLRYQGNNKFDQRELSRLAAGTLPATIVRSMIACAESGEQGGLFSVFSAHDNTIMAIMSHLGFRDFPIPCFAAFIAFELHENDGSFFVKVLYNPDPEIYGIPGGDKDDEYVPLNYFRIPGVRQVVSWNERESGSMSLEEFEHILMNDRASFESEHAWINAKDATIQRRNSIMNVGETFSVLSSDDNVHQTLRPFEYQVAGHPHSLFTLGTGKICKPKRDIEIQFYCHVFGHPPYADNRYMWKGKYIHPLRQFMPGFFGEIIVLNRIQLCDESKDAPSEPKVSSSGQVAVSPPLLRWRRVYSTVPGSILANELETEPVQAVSTSAQSVVRSRSKPILRDGLGDLEPCRKSFSTFAFKRMHSLDSWRRYWVVVAEDRLTWYQKVSDSEALLPMGSIDLWMECSEIVSPQSIIQLRIPTPPGIDGTNAVGIRTLDTLLHVFFFETPEEATAMQSLATSVLQSRGAPQLSVRKTVATLEASDESEDNFPYRDHTPREGLSDGSDLDDKIVNSPDRSIPSTSRTFQRNAQHVMGPPTLIVTNPTPITSSSDSWASFNSAHAIVTSSSSVFFDINTKNINHLRSPKPSVDFSVCSDDEFSSSKPRRDTTSSEFEIENDDVLDLKLLSPRGSRSSFSLPATIFEDETSSTSLSQGLLSQKVLQQQQDDASGHVRPQQPASISNASLIFASKHVPPTVPPSFTTHPDEPEKGEVFIVLENLLTSFRQPCVMDLKIGTRQHGLTSDSDKTARLIEKCKRTTSFSLGLRCCGMRVYQIKTQKVRVWDKQYGRTLKTETFKECLALFFNNGAGIRRNVIRPLLRIAQSLLSTIENLPNYRLFSTSILLIYEGADQNSTQVSLKIIDFASSCFPCRPRCQSRGYLRT